MAEIKRTDPRQGPPDGVEADIQTVVTLFERIAQKESQGEAQRTIKEQAVECCHVVCAYSEGVVGFSLRERDLMFSVRIDEIIEILKVAADVNIENAASLPEKSTQELIDEVLTNSPARVLTDTEVEGLWNELVDIPFDEADSPSGMVISRDWWIFKKGTDREDIWRYFDSVYSKGVSNLIYDGGNQNE